MGINWSKPVQTKGNEYYRPRPVTIVTMDGRSPLFVIGYVGDDVTPLTWTSDGRRYASGISSDFDLMNVPERPNRGTK